jgi:hypothetical protein
MEGRIPQPELWEAVESTSRAADGKSTMKAYLGCMKQMQLYFGRRICQDLEGEEIIPVSCSELLEFLAWKREKRPNIKKVSLAAFKSACSKYRSIEKRPDFSLIETDQISRFLKGVRNQRAEKNRSDGISIEEEGKRHLKFDEYMKLCTSIMSVTGKFSTELHLGIVLSWNLCARSDTCSGIHSTHIDWEGDSLMISIVKSKRNYQEEGTQYHVYANPLNPSICPVLCLAIHCACNSNILCNELSLFHESKADNAGFSKSFRKLLSKCGMFTDLGWHSIRKGGITFGSTGTPDSATWASIQNRARWKIGGDSTVVKRYVKFDPAGDQFIGRILSGLNLNDATLMF